ncbi:hypothetical protein OH77DRAFT_1418090 [Trametes cingulata]|nr:hypothetical protein OH77DRAFT_1418090 [Trametes cingulata]
MQMERDRVAGGSDDEFENSDETVALLSLIAALSLEDIDQVQGRRKGKATDAPLSDEELAFQLFAEEASALDTFSRDLAFAQSLDKALESDARLLEEFAQAEEMARRDREYARALAEGRRPTYEAVQRTAANTRRAILPASPVASTSAVKQESSWGSSTTRSVVAPPSSSAATSTIAVRGRTEICVICRDAIEPSDSIIHAPCGDTYDVDCIVDLFRAAVADESLFPPACCRKPFDMAQVRKYLDEDLQRLFDKKKVEFGTKNRVYCHVPTCSTFLGAATLTPSNLQCTTCWRQTCGHCKAASHALSIRCTSAEDATVVALAEQEGWKRCPGCGHLVELSIGCYHMTCRCRYAFCYLCTAKWKNCKCAQWDENRLIAAAEVRVQRQGVQQPARGGGANILDYRGRVAREAERLRDDHDCAHRWRYVAGASNCDSCGHYLRVFIYHCQRCQVRACARCTRNRWI